jgi:multiple sugar transport system substrate-binding protein
MVKLKGLSLMLALVLIFGILAACASNNDSVNNNTDTAPPASDNKPVEEEKVEEIVEEPIVYPDLGGRTITFAAWWNLAPDPESLDGQERLDIIKQVESNYNVKIKFHEPLAWEEVNQTFITSVLDGKPFADLLRFQYDWALPAALKGQLQKFGDLADPEYITSISPAPLLLGEEYGFMGIDPTDASGVFYNRDIVEELGLKSPHDYLKEGNWTWETFTELAKAATKDTNNDGTNDYWGLAGWAHDFSQFAVASNDSRIVFDTENKEGLTDPKTIAAYEWIRQLHHDERVWKAIENPNAWTERDTFGTGDVLFTAGWLWQQGGFQENVNLGFVPFPMGPSGTEYVSANDAGNTWFIPAGVKDADVVLRIYNDIYVNLNDDEDYPGQNALEGRFDHQEDIDAVRMVNTPDKMVLHYQRAFESTGFPVYDITHQIIVEGQPVATAVEMYKQQAQAAIDQLVNE